LQPVSRRPWGIGIVRTHSLFSFSLRRDRAASLRARPPDSSPRPKPSPTRRARRAKRLHSCLTACEASVRVPSFGDPPVADLGRASEAVASAQPRSPEVPVVLVQSLASVTAHAESIARARTTSMTPSPNVCDADPPSALVSGYRPALTSGRSELDQPPPGATRVGPLSLCLRRDCRRDLT
jgi:hypothetical protein